MRVQVDFERLVREQHAGLYRFALSLTKNEHDACDLTQQTFFQWARKGHQLSDASKVKSWLFTTLYREFLGRERRANRFPHDELDDVEPEFVSLPPAALGSLDWEVVSVALGKIEPTFRAAVTLFYLEDYSYNEIAAILKVPLGTVKSRIARGLGRLQSLLKNEIEAKPVSERKKP